MSCFAPTSLNTSSASYRCIKVELLPSSGVLFCTHKSNNLSNPKFCQTFCVGLQETKVASKTLRVQVWCMTEQGHEDCLVGIGWLIMGRGISLLYGLVSSESLKILHSCNTMFLRYQNFQSNMKNWLSF